MLHSINLFLILSTPLSPISTSYSRSTNKLICTPIPPLFKHLYYKFEHFCPSVQKIQIGRHNIKKWKHSHPLKAHFHKFINSTNKFLKWLVILAEWPRIQYSLTISNAYSVSLHTAYFINKHLAHHESVYKYFLELYQ